MNTISYLILSLYSLATISCSSNIYLNFTPKSKFNRMPPYNPKTQISYDDSTKVYFTAYPEIIPKTAHIWFYNELEGDIVLQTTDYWEKDTIEARYEFDNQGPGLYSVRFVSKLDDFEIIESSRRSIEKRGNYIAFLREIYINDTLRCKDNRKLSFKHK